MKSTSMGTRAALLVWGALAGTACSAEVRKNGDDVVDDTLDPSTSVHAGLDGGARSGSGGGSVDPNQPAPVGAAPTYAPNYPGAGNSGDGAPLTNGKLCDYVPANGAPSPHDITTCFFSGSNPVPAAMLEQVLECADGKDAVHIRLTFNPNFVDNTYGTGSIGWPRKRGHTFRDLYKSDHAEILMKSEAGATVARFKIDYLSEDPTAPSGFGTLGVQGGDGSMIEGNAAWILETATSIDKNLNERGYGSYQVDSPATDANYTVNPAAPNWDYRVVYEAWVDVHAFDPSGFGFATIESVHASPAKGESDTLVVEPRPCPPETCVDPEGCASGPNMPDGGTPSCGGPDAPCGAGPGPDGAPDASCGGPDAPCGASPIDPPKPPETCESNPMLPGCKTPD